jgi:hypothetical protein
MNLNITSATGLATEAPGTATQGTGTSDQLSGASFSNPAAHAAVVSTSAE